MLDRALFALGFGIGLPCLLWAIGAELPISRYGAWGVVGFTLGWALPTALDWLYQWGKADEISQIKARDANTAATEVSTAERWARLNTTVAAVETPIDTRKGWYDALTVFLLAGNSGGFSIRRMQGIVGSDTWADLTSMLADAGWLTKTPGRGYIWAEGYDLTRAMIELRAGRLPYPDTVAPVVNVPVNDATRRDTTRQPQQA